MQCSRIRAKKKKKANKPAKEPTKKKPRCHLLTARPNGARLAPYFIDLAFCAFM
jgi:hypothetical protein